ncbi:MULTISPECIES: hypothetical protein [Streptomyces]|uniref:hypothetical protein n=1 Tax=Streptomyces TaxID=1883 RepID=UPI0019849B36|nr:MULTISPECIES: hypothetical protein [Streptomyces]MCC2277358.1 hypothetical protein [Streptomyces sp. ET3-23]GHF43116.1 hypothetical protein GCM10010359_52180 [Streptomyces morookaense]
MRLLQHLSKLTAPEAHARVDCPRVSLTLQDGTERPYLLDDPGSDPSPEDGPRAAYEPRVHLAYILARQGHDARWLARFADLPLPAAHRIAEAAASPAAA